MRSTSLSIANIGKETGALLEKYLSDRGVYDPHSEAVVCYGLPQRGYRYSLNSNCGKGKLHNLQTMSSTGVNVIPWFIPTRRMLEEEEVTFFSSSEDSKMGFPLLARRTYGHGGADIVPVFQREEIPWRVAAGWTWFSTYVPIEEEFRVWIFRGGCLDVYEKRMMRPGDYKRVGRNFENGFEFILGTEYPAGVILEAVRAVTALEYDFGAVDLVYGKDGRVYVLEVNTAPGVIRSGAQRTLGKLADAITAWVEDGYPSS